MMPYVFYVTFVRKKILFIFVIANFLIFEFGGGGGRRVNFNPGMGCACFPSRVLAGVVMHWGSRDLGSGASYCGRDGAVCVGWLFSLGLLLWGGGWWGLCIGLQNSGNFIGIPHLSVTYFLSQFRHKNTIFIF